MPGKNTPAHRVVYELLVGPIPDGLVIDHVCHNRSDCPGGSTCPHRACCNPAHMEPVTNRENVRRGRGPASRDRPKITICKRGHDLTDPNNLVPSKVGKLNCRQCRNIRRRQRYARLGQ